MEETSSSCTDTAPLATVKPKKVAPKIPPKPDPKKAIKSKQEVAADDDNEEPDETPAKDKTKEKAIKKVITAKERFERYSEEQAAIVEKDPATKVEKKNPKQMTAAERKNLMASTSSAKGTEKNKYGVTLEQQWHDKQGPAYRKLMDQERKKKRERQG